MKAAKKQNYDYDIETLHHGDPEMTSLVSYPRRVSQWGDSRFRGNCDGTLFKNLVLRYGAKRVADPMMGSGTTFDVIEGLNHYRERSIGYWGGDLKRGFNLMSQDLPGTFDFVWVHPPYWNIIRYSNDPRDLSVVETYPEYVSKLRVCLVNCYDALERGGRLAVLVGDVRRAGKYYPIVRDVMNLEGHVGELRSVIVKAQHNCSSDRIRYARMEDVPIQHEYCVVFKKPQGVKNPPLKSRISSQRNFKGRLSLTGVRVSPLDSRTEDGK